MFVISILTTELTVLLLTVLVLDLQGDQLV